MALRERITARLKHNLGIGCLVELMPPRSVPRSEGKAVRVVDKRKV